MCHLLARFPILIQHTTHIIQREGGGGTHKTSLSPKGLSRDAKLIAGLERPAGSAEGGNGGGRGGGGGCGGCGGRAPHSGTAAQGACAAKCAPYSDAAGAALEAAAAPYCDAAPEAAAAAAPE
jgi:hypothetical protein